jgi:hypothetical protein
MKSDIDKLLLTAALAPPLKAKTAWQDWSSEVEPADAPHVLSWAGGYIYRNLKSIGVENHYLRGIFRHNFLANNFRISQVKETITALTGNWEITPIKSYGLSIQDNSLGLRPIADFDFFIRSKYSSQVFQFLEEVGFNPNLGIRLSEFKSRHYKRRGSWNFMNDEGFDLDLHWRLFDHLSTDENERLLHENSNIVETKHGKFRMLTPELTTVLLVNHHLLNKSSHYSGLFDIYRVTSQSNLDTSETLAAIVGIRNEMQDILEEIDQYAETTNAAKFSVNRNHCRVSHNDLLINKSIDYELMRLGFLYRLWNQAERPVWLEKLVTKFLGGFVKTNPAEQEKFQSFVLGSGWHYQYPGDEHRWLNIGDSRFTYTHETKGTFRVMFKYEPKLFNLVSHVESLDVYANGELIGTINKFDASPEYEYLVKGRKKVEFSLRSVGKINSEPLTFKFNWRILALPLLQIQISRFGNLR